MLAYIRHNHLYTLIRAKSPVLINLEPDHYHIGDHGAVCRNMLTWKNSKKKTDQHIHATARCLRIWYSHELPHSKEARSTRLYQVSPQYVMWSVFVSLCLSYRILFCIPRYYGLLSISLLFLLLLSQPLCFLTDKGNKERLGYSIINRND